MDGAKITAQVLEQLHYINFPAMPSIEDVAYLEGQIPAWTALPVALHILDLKGMTRGTEPFFRAIKAFAGKLKAGQLVCLNVGEDLQREIAARKLQSTFNTRSLQDLDSRKPIEDGELRRLLIRYLIRAAYSAVEVALNSTVSCDENYLARIDKVPFNEFDLISVVDVRGDFLNAQFRLCASKAVLERLAARMLGATTVIETDMIESMALELLNLIYGHAKSNLNDQEGFRLPSAIPQLLKKNQFGQIKRSTSPADISILPLVTPMGAFYVEIDFGR
jgi:hypothetical protein